MSDSPKRIHSVDKAVRIINSLQKLDEAGVTEIADHLGMKKATVHHHLRTLENNELIVQSQNSKYQLGIRFLEYGEYAKQKLPIYEMSIPEVDKLAEKTGELGNLLVEEHGRGIYLHRARGEQAITLDTGTGTRVYLHHTALGKAVLAHLPTPRVEEILDRHGLPQTSENTITDRDALFDELRTIRAQGYAVDNGERVEEVRAVAAPVMKKTEVLGAVSVAGPTSRFEREEFTEELPPLVKEAADVISVNLTYS